MKSIPSLPSLVRAGRRMRTGCILSLLAVLVAPRTASAAVAPVSAPNRENRIVLDVPPGPDNPRNSEGAFLALKDGGILFVYSHFLGDSDADAASAYLAARVSHDNGETWTRHDTVVLKSAPGAAMNIMSVSLMRMRNGNIGLFYLCRRSWHDLRMELIRSADEGRTWSAPVECMPTPGYYVVNNDRVVRLANGRLVIPAAAFRALSKANEPSAVDWRAQAAFFLSDDDGRTWRQAPGVGSIDSTGTRTGLQEPGVVEMTDGELWGWARTDQGRQYQFFSRDSGLTWSQPQPSRFTSPVSPLSMKRIPGSDRYLAVWNPHPHSAARKEGPVGGDRTPLVLAIGRGPAGPWTAPLAIEGHDGRDAGYAYTAMHFVPGGVLLAYCAGGAEDHGMLNRLRIRKLGDAYFEQP